VRLPSEYHWGLVVKKMGKQVFLLIFPTLGAKRGLFVISVTRETLVSQINKRQSVIDKSPRIAKV